MFVFPVPFSPISTFNPENVISHSLIYLKFFIVNLVRGIFSLLLFHNRTYTGTAVVLAIQIPYKFIYLVEVDCYINLTQQMVCRNHLFQTYKFDLVSIFYIFRKHVHRPYLLYHISLCFTRKMPPFGDLFRQAETATIVAVFFGTPSGTRTQDTPIKSQLLR